MLSETPTRALRMGVSSRMTWMPTISAVSTTQSTVIAPSSDLAKALTRFRISLSVPLRGVVRPASNQFSAQ
ncbi:hypothetical protein [Rhodobacter sp. SGA-6-6]|uniref:hypothetical protein n=1 Tax=Rhodobacter sp. SGA-6-6 TaxID=2710882 RepID=UPI003743B7E6